MDSLELVQMSEQELAIRLASLPGERVTKELIDSRIKDIDYIDKPDFAQTLTICNISLDNGFSVRGESACVDPANYSKAIGHKLAFENAYGKLWPLFGFLLSEKRCIREKMGAAFREPLTPPPAA